MKEHEYFKDIRQSIEDDERPDDPHVDIVILRANRRLAIRELAEEYGISIGPCYESLIENELKELQNLHRA